MDRLFRPYFQRGFNYPGSYYSYGLSSDADVDMANCQSSCGMGISIHVSEYPD